MKIQDFNHRTYKKIRIFLISCRLRFKYLDEMNGHRMFLKLLDENDELMV